MYGHISENQLEPLQNHVKFPNTSIPAEITGLYLLKFEQQ